MKQMNYTKENTFEILESNEYKGFDFKIVSYGTHPCCYVAIRKDLPIYKLDYCNEKLENIDCHGGLTFSDFVDFGDGKQWYIGWDYNHLGDYSGIYINEILFNHDDCKKWTVEEMRLECLFVIEQLLKEY